MGRIVVGFDGSEESHQAFAWALDAARLRDADVVLVHAYEHVPLWQLYGLETMAAPEVGYIAEQEERTAEELRSRAAEMLADAVVGASGDSEVAIETAIHDDRRPAAALLEHAEGAELLVVGSRGRGGFKGLLLGSVSQECASKATCPVVVVSRSAVAN